MADDKVFHSFKIIGDPNSIYKKILLDGKEMKGVRSASIIYRVDEIPVVYLGIMATDIEVDEPKANVAMMFLQSTGKKDVVNR